MWDDERTRPDLVRPSLSQAVAHPSEDEDLAFQVGLLMRQTVQNTHTLQALTTEFHTLAQEVRQHARGIESDRPVLAKGAAQHASNRMAVLLGVLFTIYETSAPYLHEIWKALHK